MPFPLSSVNERTYEPGWRGEVFICDIDRTYLYTRFSSLKGLSQIPFEFAIDKQGIEGMAPLLREVRRGPGRESRQTPLYFISASPSQLRGVIQRKMLLDGLEFDGTVFKDWVGVVASLRLRRLKEQLGFKLTALLHNRRELPEGAEEVLIGDDLEADALTFTLFADALARRIDERQLMRILLAQGVAYDDAQDICRRALELPGGGGAVKRAYIRLERHDEAEAFLDYAPGVLACRGAFQMAVSLWQDGSISVEAVERVAADLRERGRTAEELASRLADCCRRGLCPTGVGVELLARLEHRALLAPRQLPQIDPAWAQQAEQRTAQTPWTPRRLWPAE
jgi:hypothetical protein